VAPETPSVTLSTTPVTASRPPVGRVEAIPAGVEVPVVGGTTSLADTDEGLKGIE
jgi:hypothetical protein